MPDPDMTAAEQKAHAEALKRISECGRRRGSALSLSGLNLTRLPSNIVQLTKLTDLDLSSNPLLTVPPELVQLTSLTRLDLSGNSLGSLPPEITQLASLTLLYLSNNKLVVLPPEIGRLVNLTRLDLSNNPLRHLPPELGQLAHLTRLDLSNNRLDDLPPQLGQLANLTRLILSDNRLRSLPPELGQLANLTRLIVCNNSLDTLPPEIGQLARLTVLDLSNNQLRCLPPEIGQLVNLTALYLQQNALAGLPPEVGQLAKLTVLWLMANSLEALPESLRELELLDKLFLHDNPALQLSPSVLGGDPRKSQDLRLASAKSILDFYFARQTGKARPLNEVKLLLLGPGGAGKTSIVQALRDLPFREREASTTGIAVCEWSMAGNAGPAVTAHVWDFSGQELTHALHPFFFSKHSLYVLVLAGGREHQEGADAEYWLRLIQTIGTDAQGAGPAVIVAMNKWNAPGCRPEVDRNLLRDRYPFIRGFVEMDCKAKKGIPALKAALCRELERMPWIREPFPEPWDAVRRALAADPARRAHLTYDEYRELCVDHGVMDEGLQDYLSETLHHLGIALCYRNDPRLHESSVLQPEWLTKHAYALRHRAEKQAGILKHSDLEMVLQMDEDESNRACLMRIMQSFGIVHPAQAAAAGLWLVPQALPCAPPTGLLDAFSDALAAKRLRYTYQKLPEDLVERVIMRRFDFIEELNEKKLLWRGGVILARKGARALIQAAPQDHQVRLTVIGPHNPRHQLADLCQLEMSNIHAEIPGLEPTGEFQTRDGWLPIPAMTADPGAEQDHVREPA